MTTIDYPAGSLVNARGRDWLVLPGSPQGTLLVRPLGGHEHETTVLLTHIDDSQRPRLIHRPSTTVGTPVGLAYCVTRSDSRSAPAAARSVRSHAWP